MIMRYVSCAREKVHLRVDIFPNTGPTSHVCGYTGFRHARDPTPTKERVRMSDEEKITSGDDGGDAAPTEVPPPEDTSPAKGRRHLRRANISDTPVKKNNR